MSQAASANSPSSTDRDLIRAARGGSQQAFGELVARHQRCVCALVYALTGSFSQSEDIAQETFVRAWRRLAGLRSPERFRPWLYTIARNLIHRSRRNRGHPLASMLVPLSAQGEMGEVPSVEPSPLERVITREEERVIWRALDAVPESYRVPLILFYSENQSVAGVAEALGLSEKAVKMRLSRGRRMVHEQVTALLEAALARGRPGKTFTAAVMAAIAAGGAGTARAAAEDGNRLRPGMAKALFASGIALVAALTVVGLKARSTSPRRPAASRTLATASARLPSFIPEPDLPHAPPAATAVATAPGPSLVGEETGTLFSFDFDDGVVPPIFSEGAVVAGSACGGSHHCLVGTIKPEYYDTMAIVMRHDPERSLFRYTGRLTLSFDYWLGRDADDYVIVTLWDHEKATPYYYNIFNHSTREVWTHVDIPLSDLAPRNTGDPPLDRGDGFCKLAIRGGRVGGKPFYVDNFKVVRR